jgi:integrase
MSKGSIIKREGKNGVSWLLKYNAAPDPLTGERRQRYETVKGTKKEAQAELRRLLSEVDKGTDVDPTNLTLREWSEQWLKKMESRVSPRTVEGYSDWLRLHVLPTLGDKKLQTLRGIHISQLYDKLLANGFIGSKKKDQKPETKGLSAQTVLHIHRALFQMMRAATALRLIPRNIVEDVEAPRPAQARQHESEAAGETVKVFSREELSVLLSAFATRAEASPKDYSKKSLHAFVILALASGCRRGELLALRWSDLDFEKGLLTVAGAISKTRKFGIKRKSEAKNKSSRRTIGIDPGVLTLLNGLRNEQKLIAVATGKLPFPADSLVFPHLIKRAGGVGSETGEGVVDFNRPLDPTSVTKEFALVAQGVGLNGRSLHALRHSHATDLLISGQPVHIVAMRLGHSTPAVTLKTYAHWLPHGADQAASAASNLMSAVLPPAGGFGT